jgi:2-polyprenyl-3-methyl-5-hydroxy-6-metoxy-1,4-benzoquinol methylase
MNGAAVRNYCGKHVRLVGVEAFGEYVNPLWDLYNRLYIQSIQEYLDSTDEFFEVILMTDVIEHFDVDEGISVINRLKKRLHPNGAMFVSTPSVWIEQGAAHGNEYETHRSLWREDMFEALGFTVVRKGTPCKYGHMMIIGEYLNR